MTPPMDQSRCPASRHDTEHAYWSDGCRCRDAVAANSAYRAGVALGQRRLIPAVGTVRRIQAMRVDGHRLRDLADELLVTRAAMTNLLARGQVHTSTAWLVAALGAKLRGIPGRSSITSQRACSQWWLPWEAWQYGDIDDPAPVTEHEALVGWLHAAEDPAGNYGPLAHLFTRLDQLLPLQRAAMGRKARALYRAGHPSPMVREAALIYDRDRARLRRMARPGRWLAA